MSSISPISTPGYELRYDATRPGGMALTNTEGRDRRDSVAISQTGRELAAQAAAMRDEAARQMDAATRYQAALGIGQDFATYMDSNINRVDETGRRYTSTEVRGATDRQSRSFTTVSAQGTVIGISYLAAENSHIADKMPEVYTAQITRKDGLQLNITLDEDVRINDLEDGGLSLYYASSGMTRTFDAEGRETVAYGEKNILGTGSDDIIINRSSMSVDAGAGNDTIINLADGAELLGGEGDDTILLPDAQSRGVTIDGGAGNDRIIGQSIINATVNMGEGNDTLTATAISKASITSSGDDSIKAGWLMDSSLASHNGALSTNIASLSRSAVTIDKVSNDFSVDQIYGSNLRFGDGDISLSANSINDSDLVFGDGDISLSANSINESNLVLGSGDATLNSSHMHSSVFTHNIGNTTINGTGTIDSSTLNLGSGDNSIKSGSIVNSTVNSQSGENKIDTGNIMYSDLNLAGGDNTINSLGIHDSVITTGSGGNTLNATGINNSTLNLGDGDNTLTAIGGINDSRLNLGNGGNSIETTGVYQSNLNMGTGGNFVQSGHITESTLSFTDANGTSEKASETQTTNTAPRTNTIRARSLVDSHVQTGEKNVEIELDVSKNSNITTGNGHANIDIRSFNTSAIKTGNGNDNINIDNAFYSHVDAGEGNNRIGVNSATNSSLRVGSGKNEFLTDVAVEMTRASASASRLDLDSMFLDALFDAEDTKKQGSAAEGTRSDVEREEASSSAIRPEVAGETMPWLQTEPNGSARQTNESATDQRADARPTLEFSRRMAQAAAAYARRA